MWFLCSGEHARIGGSALWRADGGCVLNAVNIRLDVDTLRYIFSHSEARAVFVDGEFADKVKAALDGLDKKPLVIDIVDSQSGTPTQQSASVIMNIL